MRVMFQPARSGWTGDEFIGCADSLEATYSVTLPRGFDFQRSVSEGVVASSMGRA
jgi:hypothetical protein